MHTTPAITFSCLRPDQITHKIYNIWPNKQIIHLVYSYHNGPSILIDLKKIKCRIKLYFIAVFVNSKHNTMFMYNQFTY